MPENRQVITKIILLTHWVRPRQNGRHFADDTFNRIFVNENVRIAIEFSLKFVLKRPINNIPALVQIMAWRRRLQATCHDLNQWWLIYRRINASLGLNELTIPSQGPCNLKPYVLNCSGTLQIWTSIHILHNFSSSKWWKLWKFYLNEYINSPYYAVNIVT